MAKINLESTLTEDELLAGMVLSDRYLFSQYFYKDEFKLPPSREQRLMLCDESDHILFCTGRKIAKTVILELTIVHDGITNVPPDGGVDEALFFTPGEVHLDPFVGRVFDRLERTPILWMFVTNITRGDAPTVNFATGLKYFFRIEGTSGTDRNMVGIRAKYVRGDEMAFGNWVCHNSRIQTALPDAVWMYCGVPNSVRSTPFYALDQTELGASWSRHKWPTYINPIYQKNHEKSERDLVEAYGGKESQGYVTQVLGGWGDEMRSSFPPESLSVHNLPFYLKTINGSSIELDRMDDPDYLGIVIGIPSVRCEQFALGWDYGYSPDPSIIYGGYRQQGSEKWVIYFGVELIRVPQPMQVAIGRFLISKVFSGSFIGLSSDNVSLIQALQGAEPSRGTLFFVAEPGGSIQVPVIIKDETSGLYEIADNPTGGTKMISIRRKEFYTDLIRQWMTASKFGLPGRKMQIPNNPLLINELVGTVERKTAAGYTIYMGPPDPERRGAVMDHRTDTLRFFTHAVYQGSIVGAVDEDDQEDVEAYGWIPVQARENVSTWKPPWGGA